MRLKKYLPLFLITLSFASPMLLAHAALVFQDKIKQSTTSYGRLIPAGEQLRIAKFENLLPDSNKSSPKWRILFISPLKCDADCKIKKDSLIQLHALLRDDKDRVEVISALATNIRPMQESGEVLLLAPTGNHVMSYDKAAEPSGILKDLMRLLKYSNV